MSPALLDALSRYGDDGEPIPDWGVKPSPFDWQVLLYDVRRLRLAPHVMQFFKRKFSAGYTREYMLERANFEASWMDRERFAVRDTDGTIIFNGPVHNELGKPRTTA